MDNSKLRRLELQITSTIPLIEREYNNNPSDMVRLIHKRFIDAQNILKNRNKREVAKEDFYLDGSSRAFLEVSSDYGCLLLEELGKAEKIFVEVFS
ncbi:hypothetical protein [Alkalihalobacillus sp. R86527]|uniref:hypothetical protein n=1 Tax=Alkalihalobacillus sp. R86527 TaxID=3093863 RepID=UPI00366F19A9